MVKKTKFFQIIKTIFPIVLVLFVIVTGLNYIKSQTNGEQGGGPSSYSLKEEMGLDDFFLFPVGEQAKVSFSTLKGRIFFVNFWASWCSACIIEMPSIVKLGKKFKNEGLEIISINVDENPENIVPRFIKKFDMQFNVYKDEKGMLSQLFNVHAIPLTVIMDSNRKVLYIETGDRDWSSEAVITQVKRWLAL